MNPKFNRFILIENVCLVLIILMLVIVPVVNKTNSEYTKQTNKELKAENDKLKEELKIIQKAVDELSQVSQEDIVSKLTVDNSGDCSLPKDTKIIQDIKKDYPELVDVVYKEAITHNINKDYLIAVILTESGFQKGDNGFLGLFDVHNVVLLLEDVMTQEIHNFLRQSGIKTDEELLTEDTSDSVFHKSFSYEKSYVKVFGRDKLNKLYNNYKLVSGKPFSSLK